MGIVSPQMILFVSVQDPVFYLKVQPIFLYLFPYFRTTTQKVKYWFIHHLGPQVKQYFKNPDNMQHFHVLPSSYFHSF